MSRWNRRQFLKSAPIAAGVPFLLPRSSGAEITFEEQWRERLEGKDISPEEVIEAVPHPIIPERPDLKSMYDKCWKLGLVKSELGITGSGFVDWYIDAAFDNRIFQWDTCFSLTWAKYSQGSLPNIESLENFYRKQHPDGAISGVIRKKTGEDDQPKESPWFTRNNLFSWSEWEYYQVTGDASRFERVIPILKRYAEWVRENRRHENGHFYWSGWSSGMDNSPRSVANKFYPPHSWVDYDANEALAAWYLAKMAEAIGEEETADEYRAFHREMKDLVNTEMWSEKDRFYWDLDKDGSFLKVKTVASFWPMWGRLTEKSHVDGLVKHLNDAVSFNRPHRVPTCAADEEKYAPSGRYWRGSVWAPTNHMVVEGLIAQGRLKLARDIVLNHLNNQAAVFSGTETVWENYAPEFTKPGAPSKGDFVGWSAAGPIAQLIENYIGINISVPENRVTWNLLTTEEVGIENLQFGETTLKLVAAERKHMDDPVEITVDTGAEFELELYDGQKVYRENVQPDTKNLIFGKE